MSAPTPLNSPAGGPRRKVRIGDLLVQAKVISETQLMAALAEQKKTGRKLGRTLVDLGFVAEDALLKALSTQLGVMLVDLKHHDFKPEVVRLLPETHARRYRALVLHQTPNELVVGMADPSDIFAYDELARILKRPIKLALVRESDLVAATDVVYRRTEEISTLAEELREELAESDFDLAQLVAAEQIVDAPVIKLLQSMFEDAVQVGASDIHIEPDESVLRIRQRVDGELHEQVIEGRRIAAALVTRLKLMSQLDISEKRLPQDGRFSIRVKDKNLDVRLSTMPIQHGESVVMRLLDQSAGLLTLDKLGIPADMLARFEGLISRPTGMILVTGPTGSGKTTTLYAAVNHINTPDQKIITVEDPVEYRLPRVNQVHINPKIGLTFAKVLRSALRQDPDVILVGEMRDQETAEIGLRAAMTGHLVLSTLHTNDAIATISRLVDMGVERYMIAAALDAIVAQRLVRRVCDACRREVAPTPQQGAFVAQLVGTPLSAMVFVKGEGCTYCNGSGYRGRIGVYEMLEMDERLVDALRGGDLKAFAEAAAAQPGFRSFARCALDYARAGVTSLDEVMRVSGGIERYADQGMEELEALAVAADFEPAPEDSA